MNTIQKIVTFFTTLCFLCVSIIWANDVNQDNKTGLPEAIHALKVSSGMSDDIQCNHYSLDAVDGDPENAVYVNANGKAIFNNKIEIKIHIVTLTDTETDLGIQLQNLINRYQKVRVYLPENTTWNWDTNVNIYEDHLLGIWALPQYVDVNKISVTINMKKRNYQEISGIKNRTPTRALVHKNAHLYIRNVHIVETINDDTTMSRVGYGSLFNIFDYADNGRIEIIWSKAWTTENLCGFGGGRGFGRIVFGHTSHYMHDSCTVRDHVYTVFTDNGWSFDGQGGVVSNSHVTQGIGVTFQRSPKIKYLYGGSISEQPGGNAYIDSTLHIKGNIISNGDICIGKCL
ncbi:conserved hypothetical protein, secreted [Candidatus Magnetomorum sp. HK-1]|nr:conserved hypothetical protein, secreted [Candidatus Magnetomorum sp. HK-1]